MLSKVESRTLIYVILTRFHPFFPIELMVHLWNILSNIEHWLNDLLLTWLMIKSLSIKGVLNSISFSGKKEMAGIWKSLGPISDEKKLWSLTVRASLVVQKLIIANPGLNVNPGFFFFCSRLFSWMISLFFLEDSFIRFRTKWINLNLLFKLSYLNSNFAQPWIILTQL